MNESRFGRLEVLARSPRGKARDVPLLFVHGAYAGAWCWEEHFLPFFAERGWSAYAVSLSGHGGSPGREHLDSLSLEDYIADVAEVVSRLPAVPVLIGHSMGGMVLQKYLERAGAPALVLLASVPPQGLWASALGVALNKPNLLNDLNRLLGGGQVALDTLREAMFAQPVRPEDLQRYYLLMQPESFRAVWDMTLFNLPRLGRMHRPPMLVLGGECDTLISPTLVELTARSYDIRAELFPGMGHGMMLEAGWREVAERIETWLVEHGL